MTTKRLLSASLLGLLSLITVSVGCPSGDGAPEAPPPAAAPAVADPELTSAPWQLEAAGNIGEEEAVPGEQPITLELHDDGGAYGFSGCNRYSTAYHLDGQGGIRFGAVAVTRMACPSEAMDLEKSYLEWLASVSSYEVGEGQLMLFYDETTQALLFVAAPATSED